MPSPELSIIIPALHEGENLRLLLPQLRELLRELDIDGETLVVTSPKDPETGEAARAGGAKVVLQTQPGYGGALKAGFEQAQAGYILTMDADLSHPPNFIRALWENRDEADLLIASRYVKGGRADMPFSRFILSKVLNRFFSMGLQLPVRDMSSGFRLYHAGALSRISLEERDFNVLQEILVKLAASGGRLKEIPFAYAPRKYGSSNARVFAFGMAYLRTFGKLRRMRF